MTEEQKSQEASLQTEIETNADVPRPTFESLGVGEAVLSALTEMGFEGPTDVQVQAVPIALTGKDLLVQSRTGSGKTAAFGIPMVEKLVDPSKAMVQALVLAPTRELALQVSKELERIAAKDPAKVVAIYGGAAMGPQVKALEDGAQIVAGTPGRVLDLIRRKSLDTSNIKLLVLDEADEMLSMGFLEDINKIIESLPEEHQTMLFSATIPGEIERLIKRYLKDPTRLYLSEDFVGVREIDHVYYLVTGGDRPRDLLAVLQFENPELALIFCNTRDDTARVANFLSQQGFPTEGISSDLSQSDRERVMKRMRAGELRYLVATDIAARGIDINDISHVINFAFPESADVYVHRTGRTARAGKSGVAISLVSPRELGSFYYLKLIHKIFPEERHLPSAEELVTRSEAARLQELVTRYEDRRPSAELLSLARRIWTSCDATRLVALMLEEHFASAQSLPKKRSRREERPKERAEESKSSEPRERSERDSRGPRDGRGERGERGRRGRDDAPRGDRSRGRRDEPRAEGGERKRTRSRPDRAPRTEEAPLEAQEAFTTSDGDVEFYETVDADAAATPAVEKKAEPQVEEGMARLYVNMGRRHNLRPEELTSFLQIEGELGADDIGSVEQLDRHSYVNVRDEVADPLIERLSGRELLERPVRLERAKPPRSRTSRPSRPSRRR